MKSVSGRGLHLPWQRPVVVNLVTAWVPHREPVNPLGPSFASSCLSTSLQTAFRWRDRQPGCRTGRYRRIQAVVRCSGGGDSRLVPGKPFIGTGVPRRAAIGAVPVPLRSDCRQCSIAPFGEIDIGLLETVSIVAGDLRKCPIGATERLGRPVFGRLLHANSVDEVAIHVGAADGAMAAAGIAAAVVAPFRPTGSVGATGAIGTAAGVAGRLSSTGLRLAGALPGLAGIRVSTRRRAIQGQGMTPSRRHDQARDPETQFAHRVTIRGKKARSRLRCLLPSAVGW